MSHCMLLAMDGWRKMKEGGSGKRKGGSFVSLRPREPKKVERNGMDGDTLSAGKMGVFPSLFSVPRLDESEAYQVLTIEGSNFQIVHLNSSPHYLLSATPGK